MTWGRAVVLLGIAVLALLGFFQFPGHTWLQQDTQIYVPMFEHIWDPTILPNDIVAAKPHLAYTLYDETAIVLRWITRVPFHLVLAAEQIFFRILELLGVFLLARSFALSRVAAFVVTAGFGLGAYIAGPEVLTFEYEPVPRGFALGCLMLAVGLAASDRLMLAGIAAGVAVLIHAPTAAPVCLVLIVIAVRRRTWKPVVPWLTAGLLVWVASRFQAGGTELQPLFARITPDWEQIERVRAAYNWVSTWVNPLIWQYVLYFALAMAALWRLRPRCGRLFSIGLPLLGFASVPFAYLCTEVAKWSLMPQVQPARTLLWVTAFTVILGAAAATRAAGRGLWWESIAWFTVSFAIPFEARTFRITMLHLALAVGLAALATVALLLRRSKPLAAAMLAVAIVAPYFVIPLLGHVKNYPSLHNPELDSLAEYARSNTPKNAIFFFPDAGKALYPGLFRAEAIRPVYVDWKAGGQVNYFHSLALEWWKRWNQTRSASLDHLRESGITYAVVKKENRLYGLEPVYSNDRFLVYAIGTSNVSVGR